MFLIVSIGVDKIIPGKTMTITKLPAFRNACNPTKTKFLLHNTETRIKIVNDHRECASYFYWEV